MQSRNNPSGRSFKKTILIVLAALLGLTGIGAWQYSDVYFQIKKNFSIFSDVYKEVTLRYVDEVDPEKLMRKAINSMLETLDPYTVLIDEAKNQQIDMITTGNYAGVGLEVGFRGGQIVIIAPMEGYSAYRKGVRAGDVLKEVDGIPVSELTPEEVQDMMRGEPGTMVNITIERYGIDQALEFELERERIEVKNVAYSGLVGPDKRVGYILLRRFSQNTADEIRTAIQEMKEEGEPEAMILDLRNNPGGLLSEAVRTVDKFIEPGVKVVETKGRMPEHSNVMKSEETPIYGEKPLFVLINNGSASASEVVAGAIQDLDRGIILGERSFGKGLVQVIRPLSYNTAIKITTSKYYTPSGRSIQALTYTHDEENSGEQVPDSLRKAFNTRNGRTVYDGRGIAPDIEVKDEKQSLLQVALMQKSHYFFFANQYYSGHPDKKGSLSQDSLYMAFRDYLKSKDFSFKTRSERYLADLENSLDKSELKDGYRQHLTGLETVIEQEKEQAFKEHRDDIESQLYLELISRYEGRSGRIKASTAYDNVIQKAIELSNDQEKYHSVLSMKQ